MSDAVKTIEDFLAIVRRSGLVDSADLDAATTAWPDRSQPLPVTLVDALVEAELLTRWQADQLRKGRHKGFVLGKYKLLRLLGAGGMSSVYLAEHATLHNKVAIKVLPIKRVDQTSYLARFEREARQSARLSHPNIVRVFDLDTSGAIHYIAMEYLDGIDLHAKVKADGPLDVRSAVDFIRQAALGLQHAHEEGLVHRDIKPANLMLERRGTVKVLDLGLALAREDDNEAASLTREHDEKVLGTTDYLAPEQATDSHLADRRSDIYSLGCTLYYLLVGKAPFASGKLAERIKAHVSKPPPNPLDQRPDVPPAIVELYFRMLEKHPDARPQTAQEIADAAARWLADNPVAASTLRPEAPRRPPPRRATRAGGSGSTTPATVTRSGPGSGSDMAVGRSGPNLRQGSSGVDSGALTFTPPPSAGSRTTVTSSGVLPVVTDATPDRPGTRDPAKPQARHRRPGEIGGLPLGFWLVLVGGLVLAGVLGWLVMAKRAKADDQPDVVRITHGLAARS